MTPSEIREKNLKELAVLEKDLREELFKLKMQNATGQLEKNHRVTEVKRDIARVLTVARQKRAAEKGAKA
ncbi:50S ribosomal protein L29 [Deltaproteobacteria bacterium PRO3]|nr:50S ribosomal protein L29 [Deltaproteobacteria bacterium]MDL1871150.1 50S ribosomal protein L29 [Deltaproteobacteria bacterium PRO3]